ncbi:MAG TPA: hypothetical protein VF488_04895, partial [Gemmatimonadaceae bacterium]
SFDSWLDARLEIRDSLLHGRGTFARGPIAVGETVTVWAHRVLSARELTTAPPGTLSPWGHEQWLWQPLDDQTAPDALLNHSCDSNLGMADEVTLVARRDIRGEDARTLAREILGMTQEEFSAVFKGSPTKRAKLRGLKRNAAVVLGNVGTVEDVGVLTRAPTDDEPLVREDAAWALARISSGAVPPPIAR